jgi:hypothetical protein
MATICPESSEFEPQETPSDPDSDLIDGPETPEKFTQPITQSSADETEVPEARTFQLAHVFQILVIATIIIWGYSLVMSGKRGQGWQVLMAIAGVFAYVLRAFKSVFVEVTSSNEVSDWDDE